MNASPTPDLGVWQWRGLHFNFPDFRQPQPKLRKFDLVQFILSVCLSIFRRVSDFRNPGNFVPPKENGLAFWRVYPMLGVC
jgi:hypothetical protein